LASAKAYANRKDAKEKAFEKVRMTIKFFNFFNKDN